MSNKAKTTTPKPDGKPALTPKLRFPEFRDAEGWEENILGDVCDYWNGASHEGSVTENGYYFLISLNSIDIDGNLKLDMKRLSHTDYSLQKGDLVMVLSDVAHGNFLGLTDIIPDDHFVLNQRMAGLRLKKSDQANVRFLRTTINFHQKYFKQKGQGSSQLNLSKSSVTDFPVYLPCPNEQQKIAECLSSVDELIAAQARKLDALKTHKKGLMQQLFPREGETQPRLRFPEFQNAGEWEPKTLIDACRMQAGKFVAAADIKEQNAGELFPCYGGNGLRGFTATHTHDGVYPLIGRQGALCGNVKLASGRFHATEHAVVATPYQGVEVVWVYYLLDLLNLNRFATGQAQPGLSVDVLEKVPVTIPKDESEQQRIADCLTSLDDLIAAQIQKLEALKTHKKGLMQQLFPSPEEVEA